MYGERDSALMDQPTVTDQFYEDVVAGLTAQNKHLSPKWLYDHAGSALFEQITGLPEYYPTRTETGILREHAAYLASCVPEGGALVELGAGASIKTQLLLDQGVHFGAFVPLDISAQFLFETADTLRARYERLDVVPVVADFLQPVELPHRIVPVPKVGFFPGSTIGNLEPEAARDLLARAHSWGNVQRFILGADLVKAPDTLVAAYDDASGVTAAFIKNILRRMNMELGADFDLDAFAYRATWDSALARIDMQLVSQRAQVVRIGDVSVRFDADEPIHVSAARKYTQASLTALVHAAGWQIDKMLTDPRGQFAVTVLCPTRDM
ncbi:L-histidine N(alpha)-methyltransferase [Tateyamaria sp. SN6-1]|uniref:L-histidine N(alpha)-methyltransferase n=1 Tax=Tateyamaria sp. SN6-1 TaxID=3092148 RepID=UPI0039F5F518